MKEKEELPYQRIKDAGEASCCPDFPSVFALSRFKN
jgi:hypothetical protein